MSSMRRLISSAQAPSTPSSTSPSFISRSRFENSESANNSCSSTDRDKACSSNFDTSGVRCATSHFMVRSILPLHIPTEHGFELVRSSLHLRPHHLKPLQRPRVLHPAHASDQVERVPVQTAFFQMSFVNVHRNDFPNHQTPALGRGIEVENLMQFAFEAYGRLLYSPRTHHFRGRRPDFRQFKFIDGRFIVTARQVHRLGQLPRHHV